MPDRRRGRHRDAAASPIQIEGLSDFLRDLGDAQRELRKDFNRAFRGAGDEIVEDARARYYDHYTRRTGRTPVGGIKTETHFGGVAVRLGGGKWGRYINAQEWGSNRSAQFGPARGRSSPTASGEPGTFFWPAYVAGRDQVSARVFAALDEAVATLAGNKGAQRLAGRLDVLRTADEAARDRSRRHDPWAELAFFARRHRGKL